MSLILLLVCFSFAATLTLIIYILILYLSKRKKYVTRIKQYMNVQHSETKKETKAFKTGLSVIGNTFSKISVLDKYKDKVQKELIKAHIFLKGEEFITISIISMIVFGLLFTLMFKNIIFGLVFSIVGWIVPWFFMKFKKKKRIVQLNNQLADAIILISNSLKAGYSFFQAADMVAREMHPPISEEFIQLQKEINLGYTTEMALENLSNRVESDDLGLVITAVITQRQVGGNLAEILDNISGTIRDRIKIKGEIKTLTAQGRISGMVISLIPVGLVVALQITNPEYIGVLFKNEVGWAILGAAVIMQLIGIYSIKKIIDIDV